MEERPTSLHWYNKGLTAADAPALTNVLKSKALERVEQLAAGRHNSLGDESAAKEVPRLEPPWRALACRPSPPPSPAGS